MNLVIRAPTQLSRFGLHITHGASAYVLKGPLLGEWLIELQREAKEVDAGSDEMGQVQELAEVVSFPGSRLGSYKKVKILKVLSKTLAAPVFQLCPSGL